MNANHIELASYVPGFIRKWRTSNGAPPTDCRVEALEGAILFADISGFTPLSQRLAKMGPEGAEELDRMLNALYGRLVDIIYAHGGDVVAYAGDAAIVVWPAEPDESRNAVLRAASVGLELQRQLHNYRVADDQTLSIKICIAHGDFFASYLGGDNGKWLPFVAGPAMRQICAAAQGVKAGQTVISPEARKLAIYDLRGTINPEKHLVLEMIKNLPAELNLRPPDIIESTIDTTVFLRAFVPDIVLARLDVGQAQWLADLRHMTSVFVSFQGLCIADSEDVRRAHLAVRMVQQIVRRFEGTVVQFLQDDKGIIALLCFGLPPLIHEDDADRAIAASMQIQRGLKDLAIATSIGVATGRVFSGPRGSSQRREYAITGSVVNLAARLMGLQQGGLICEAKTHGALRSTACDSLPPVKLKGITDPVLVYQPKKGKAVARDLTTISGRSGELLRVTDWLERVTQGQQQSLIIEGEAGIGKSVLMRDLQHRASCTDLRLLAGECVAIERNTPYYVWRSIIGQLLELTPSLTADEKRQRVLESLSFDQSLLRRASLLNDVLDLGVAEDPTIGRLLGRARADNLQHLVVQLLRQTTSLTPTLILLEDAHWMDASSWRLLATVMRFVELLSSAVSCRPLSEPIPDEYRQLLNQPLTTHIKLGPMRTEELVQLACGHLNVAELSSELTDFLSERSQGNPFFALEIVDFLRSASLIEVAQGVARLAPGWNRGAGVPASIRALVTARIDRLPLPPQMTLKAASVIGQTFEKRTLSSVHPQPQYVPEIAQHLNRMCESNLTQAEQQLYEVYSFKHATILQVTYDQIPIKNRRAVHSAIAQWVECEQGETASNLQLLAFHWGRANVPDREIHYLSKAGESAMRTYSNREAANAFRIAIERHEQIFPNPTPDHVRQRAHWHRLFGEALFRLGELFESETQLEFSLASMKQPVHSGKFQLILSVVYQVLTQFVHRALPSRFTSPKDVDPEEERSAGKYESALSFYRLGQIQYLTINMPQGLNCALLALNLSEPLGSSTILARSYAAVSLVSGMLRVHWLARLYARLAERTGRRIDHPPTLSHLLMTLGLYDLGVGHWERARELLKEAIALAEEVGHQTYLYEALSVAGVRACLIGEYHIAADYFQRIQEVAGKTGNELHEAVALSGLGECAIRLGDLKAAITALARAEELLAQSDYSTEEMRVLGIAALAYSRQGDTQRAIEYVERTQRCIAGSSHTTVSTLEAFSCVTEVTLSRYRESPNDKTLKDLALRACKKLGWYARAYPIGKPRDLLMLGLHRIISGRRKSAIRLFRSSLREARRRSMPFEEALASYQLGKHGHNPQTRQEYLSRAIRDLQRLGISYELDLAQRAANGVPSDG